MSDELNTGGVIADEVSAGIVEGTKKILDEESPRLVQLAEESGEAFARGARKQLPPVLPVLLVGGVLLLVGVGVYRGLT